jgi:hypothetical protein
MKNSIRLANLFFAMCCVAVLSSCNSDTKDGVEPAYNRVSISDVEDLADEAATVKAFTWNDETDDEPIELATADIEAGSATIELLETIDEQYLYSFGELLPPEIELSSPDANYIVIVFYVFDSSGNPIGELYFESETAYASLLYIDRACNVSGTMYDGDIYSEVYDMNLTKGYNWTQQLYETESDTVTSSTIINGKPADGSWVYDPFM